MTIPRPILIAGGLALAVLLLVLVAGLLLRGQPEAAGAAAIAAASGAAAVRAASRQRTRARTEADIAAEMEGRRTHEAERASIEADVQRSSLRELVDQEQDRGRG